MNWKGFINQLKSQKDGKGTASDDYMPDSETIKRMILSAHRTRELIEILTNRKSYLPISMGQNCNTAWYLRQVGARDGAYPFDWIFSSAEIAESCLKDGFATFINKKYIIPNKKNNSTGHSIYHKSMFNHRNPLKTKKDYDYYVRCINRFDQMLASEEKIIFVCTIINEPEKRPDWSKGFCNNYHLPLHQSHHTYQSFIETVRALNKNIKYLFIEQYTEGELSINSEIVNDDVLSVRFTSKKRNTGVKYVNGFDDFIAKLLYSGLIR